MDLLRLTVGNRNGENVFRVKTDGCLGEELRIELTLHFILFRKKADFISPNNMIKAGESLFLQQICRYIKAIDMNHIKNIKTLLPKTNPIFAKAKQADEEKRKRSEYFNVFNTLGLWSEEVRLHSSFLAELLNPNDNHGMWNAFLCQFLQLVRKEQPDYIQSDKVNLDIYCRTFYRSSNRKRREDRTSLLKAGFMR